MWPGRLLGQVLAEVLQHGWDAAPPSLEEVPVQGGELRAGSDEGRKGASCVGQASLGRRRSGPSEGCIKAGEVVFARHVWDVALKECYGGHCTALGG